MGNETNLTLDIDQLIETHADMVYRIAYVQMKQKSDAEDIFQEVFLKLVKNIDKIKSEDHAKHWLIRVTINTCHKEHGRAWRKRNVSLIDNQETEDVLEKDDNLEDLLEACWELPEAQRIVIHLFYLEGYSIKDISQTLEQSESAIKTRLSRGRDALRHILKEEA